MWYFIIIYTHILSTFGISTNSISPIFFRCFSIFFRCFQVIFSLLCPCAPLLPGRRTPPALHRNRIMQNPPPEKTANKHPQKKKSGNDEIKRPTPANTGASSHKTLRRSAGTNHRKFFRFLFPHAVLKRTFYKLLSLKFL